MVEQLEEEAPRFEWTMPQENPTHVQLFRVVIFAFGVTLLCAIFGLPVVLFVAYLMGYTPATLTDEMMSNGWILITIVGGLLGAACTAIYEGHKVRHWVQFWPCGGFRSQYGMHLRKKKRYPHGNADWRKFTHLDTQQLQNGQTRLRFVHEDGYFIYIPDSYDKEWASFLHMQIGKRFDKMRAKHLARGEPEATFWQVPDRSLAVRLGVAIAVAVPCGVLVVMFGQPFLPALNAATSDIVFIRKSADQINLIYPLAMATVTALLVGRLTYSFASRAKKYSAWFFANGDFFTREPQWRGRTLDRPDNWLTFAKLTPEHKRGSTRLRFEREDGTFFDVPGRLRKRQAKRVQQQLQELWDKMRDPQNSPPRLYPEAIGVPVKREVVTATITRERYGI